MSRAFGNRMLKPFVVAEPEIQVNINRAFTVSVKLWRVWSFNNFRFHIKLENISPMHEYYGNPSYRADLK